MRFLTDLADQAVILPLIAAIAATLALQGWRRGALAWLAATVCTFGAMLVLKLLFLGCGPMLGITRIASPSGHAASAALVCGGLVARFLASMPATLLGALAGAVLIGTTRLALGVHTPEEVIVGGLVGIAGAAGLVRIAGEPPRLRAWPLAVVVLGIVAALHGTRLPAEIAIRQASALIHWILPWCAPATASEAAGSARPATAP